MAFVMAQGPAHTSLGAFDDDMEISSDAGRQGDDDIDIDIDVPPQDVQVPNDDEMLDDNATETQDDVMFDEDRAAENTEEQMQEDLFDYPDEELEDVDVEPEDNTEIPINQDSHLGENPIGSLDPSHFAEDTREENHDLAQSNQPQADDIALQQALDSEHMTSGAQPPQMSSDDAEYAHEGDTDQVNSALSEPANMSEEDSFHPNDQSAELSTTQPLEDGIDHGSGPPGHSLDEPYVKTVGSREENGNGDEHHISNAAEEESHSLLPEDGAPDVHEEGNIGSSKQPLDLHPVLVHWEGEEISLFPPDDVSEFFLGDPSIATGQFRHLFSAFKEVLGDDYADPTNLHIEFDEMGLVIEEHRLEDFPHTLADIVEVHLQLHHNDGKTDPPPLLLTLTARESSAARFASLRQNAAEGKGMSLISVSNTEDNSEYHEQNFYDQEGDRASAEDAATNIEQSADEGGLANLATTGQDPGIYDSSKNKPNTNLVDGEANVIEKAEAEGEQANADNGSLEHLVADSESKDASAKKVDVTEEQHPQEEYYEEDLLDDNDDEPETKQEGLNGSESSSTIPGDDRELYESGEQAGEQLNPPDQEYQEDVHDELQMLENDPGEPDHEAVEEPAIQSSHSAEVVEPQIVAEVDNSFDETDQLGPTSGLEIPSQITDNPGTEIEADEKARFEEGEEASDTIDFEIPTNTLEIAETDYQPNEEPHDEGELDVVESRIVDPDDLDSLATAEDEQRFPNNGTTSEQPQILQDSVTNEQLDHDELDAASELHGVVDNNDQSRDEADEATRGRPARTATASPRLVRKRSLSEDSPSESGEGNDAKKARPR